MKNSLLFALTGAILFFVSCNSIDQEVVDSLQTSLNKVQESRTNIDAAAQNANNLSEQMDKAPAGLQASAQFGYSELRGSIDAFTQRYATFQNSRAEMQKKLEAVMADYTDGKIDKETALKEQKSIQESISSFQAALDRMAPIFDSLSTEYAKMSATWMSLPEAERQALSAPQAPQPGDAAPGSLQQGPVNPGNVRPQTTNSLIKPQGSGRE